MVSFAISAHIVIKHQEKEEIKVLPSIRGRPNSEKDTKNLTLLLSNLVDCTLTLRKLLKPGP